MNEIILLTIKREFEILENRVNIIMKSSPEELEKYKEQWRFEDAIDKIADAIKSTRPANRIRFLGIF